AADLHHVPSQPEVLTHTEDDTNVAEFESRSERGDRLDNDGPGHRRLRPSEDGAAVSPKSRYRRSVGRWFTNGGARAAGRRHRPIQAGAGRRIDLGIWWNSRRRI